MAIIDTFLIYFKSLGTSEVIKDEKKVEKAGDSLQKNIDKTTDAVRGMGKELVSVASSLAGVAAGALSAAVLFQSLLSAVAYTQDLSRTSKLLGVNIEELDAWGQAVTKAGGDAKTFQGSLRTLAEHLGASPRVALQALLPLANAFQKLGRFRALQYGKKLGLDEATILLLQRGRREVMAVLDEQRRLGVVTKQQQEVTDTYTTALQRSEQAYSTLSRTIANEALPVITSFLNKVATPSFEYLTEHKDLIVGAIAAIGVAAAVASAPFIPWLATITAITAALGALAIAYEDIKFGFEGKDSLTKDLWDSLTRPNYLSQEYGRSAKEQTLASIFKGKEVLNTAENAPISALTSNSILNSGGDKNSTINIGEVTVMTQSTDSAGIAAEFMKGLDSHLVQSNNQFSNGVSY